MGYAYYRIWASQVICFGWLVVVVQQGVGVVWRPDGSAEWLCVQTSEPTRRYVRPDPRQKGWRRGPAGGEVAVGYKDDQGFEAVRDHPLRGQRVYRLVPTRRYHCRNTECAQKTFPAVRECAVQEDVQEAAGYVPGTQAG